MPQDDVAAELARFRAYFEASTSGIFVYSEDGELIDINPAACRMHGFSREEMLAMDPADFIAPESYHVFEAFRDAVSRGERFHGEARGRRRDGSRFEVEVDGRLIEIEGARFLFSSLIDVTERKRLAAQLQHAQRMDALGQLAGGIAHDFNNLLSIILGYADFLAPELQGRATLLADLQAIIGAGEKARDLVQRLLAFSRRQTLQVKTVDVDALAAEQIATLRRVFPENVILDHVPSEAPSLVRADRGQLEQVVVNLMLNAQQAMPDGGTLTVRTGQLSISGDRDDVPPNLRPGEYVVLSVTDTGVGMDEATRRRVFEPFFTTKAPGEGSGLGLAMAYGIVRQHGGHLAVTSELGFGTTFRMLLPRADGDRTDAGDAPPAPAKVSRGSERVLVVEDNGAVLELVARLLGELGYEVHQAQSGLEALDVAAELDRLDLLLTDVVMPRLNGRDVFERLRRSFPGLRVVYMSGYSEEVVSHRGVLEQGVRLVRKPLLGADLARAVRETLDAAGD